MATRQPIPAILGPTCSGKTRLVSKLNPKVHEIISCDSRQIYRGLQIGTAAPSDELKKKFHII